MTTKKIRSRTNLLGHSLSVDVSGATLSHVVHKIAIPAHEKIILLTMSTIMKTPLKQLPNKKNGKMGKLAPTNRP